MRVDGVALFEDQPIANGPSATTPTGTTRSGRAFSTSTRTRAARPASGSPETWRPGSRPSRTAPPCGRPPATINFSDRQLRPARRDRPGQRHLGVRVHAHRPARRQRGVQLPDPRHDDRPRLRPECVGHHPAAHGAAGYDAAARRAAERAQVHRPGRARCGQPRDRRVRGHAGRDAHRSPRRALPRAHRCRRFKQAGRFTGVGDPGDNRVLVRIDKPRAGTYRITPESGSPAIHDVHSAEALPALHVSTHVSGPGTAARCTGPRTTSPAARCGWSSGRTASPIAGRDEEVARIGGVLARRPGRPDHAASRPTSSTASCR